MEVQRQFDIARWQWPGADVKASTFDAWWAEFEPAVPHLPVTTQEMGETWLTGFAADPQKNAFYRVASRAFEACVAGGGCDAATDVRIADFLRMLMKLPVRCAAVVASECSSGATAPFDCPVLLIA